MPSEKTEAAWLHRLVDYSTELGRAILRMDPSFVQALRTADSSPQLWDVLEAFSLFWAAHHGGSSDRLYALGSNFEHHFNFKLPATTSEATLSENARRLTKLLKQEFVVGLEPGDFNDPIYRSRLLREVLATAYRNTESWREDHIGCALAYLSDAIINDREGGVQWIAPPVSDECDQRVLTYFRDWFPPTHGVWRYIA